MNNENSEGGLEFNRDGLPNSGVVPKREHFPKGRSYEDPTRHFKHESKQGEFTYSISDGGQVFQLIPDTGEWRHERQPTKTLFTDALSHAMKLIERKL